MTVISEPDRKETAQRDAAQWVRQLHGGEATQADLATFEAWLASDPAHVRAYHLAEQVWRQAEDLRTDPEYEDLLGTPSWSERIVTWRGRVADLVRRPVLQGSVAAAVATAIALFVLLPSVMSPPTLAPVHETAVAEIRDVTLPDGSVVTLGARSKIDVSFTEETRRVTLDQGEAFFSVEKDPARPFLVRAGDTLVRVVGTKFDVHRGADHVRVSVLEGMVEVMRPEEIDVVVERRVLSAGEQVVAARGQPINDVQEVALVKPGAWRDGRLVYQSAPLSEIVADANRYYDGRILIGSEDLAGERLTTSFRAAQIDQMIETLVLALPLDVERRANGDIVLRAKPVEG